MNEEARQLRWVRQAEAVRAEYWAAKRALTMAKSAEDTLAPILREAHKTTVLARRREKKAWRRFLEIGDVRCSACGSQLGRPR